MKKRLLALLMAAVMVVALVACGGSKDDKKKSTVKVGMVTDTGGVHDGSFNQSSWAGFQKASEDLGIQVDYLESKTDADYKPNIDTFIDGGYDLIVCVGYQLADALKEKATQNPDVKFAILDDSSLSDMDNVACLMFEQSQASYLVGYVAGLTTKTDTVGFALGMSTDTMNEFGYGYCAGAIDANKNITIKQQNINSFADTAAGKTAANKMITDKADVIFHAAGGAGLGVIDACKEAKVYAIGADSDQSPIAPETILTSAMKRVDNACYDISKDIAEGNYKAGIKTYTLKDDGVGIAPTTDNIDKDVLKKVEEVQEKIKDGSVKVPKTKAEFEKQYGKNIYELAK